MRTFLILSTLAVLAGCAKPPGCADPRVTETALSIVRESLEEAAGAQLVATFDVRLDLASTVKYDSDAKRWLCEGRVKLVPLGDTLKNVNDYLTALHEVANPNLQTVILLGRSFTGIPPLSPLNNGLMIDATIRGWKPIGRSDLETTIDYSSRYSEAHELVAGVSRAGTLQLELPVKLAKGFAEVKKNGTEMFFAAEYRQAKEKPDQQVASAQIAPPSPVVPRPSSAVEPSSPSAAATTHESWVQLVRQRVSSNVAFPNSSAVDSEVVVALRIAPDGRILGESLETSSGNPAWDDAVLRAVAKTGVLPPKAGTMPAELLLAMRPSSPR